jgi:hypothetical protein
MRPSVDPEEVLQYLSWWAYVAIAVGYTVFVFRSDIISKIGKFIGFARRIWYGQIDPPDDSRASAMKIEGPLSRVMLIHGWFLLILLCSLRITALALPYLPHWMTDTFDGARHVPTSVTDLFCIFASAALAFVERLLLCSKPNMP